ncbi:zinc-binding alcohol dehydrogenase family protein [Sphingomonas aracearum]|uniref:Zinc-type alcohol dehydrogenase-like protein n=1 Tax=Sphingomonas aracearum TaxID=2283317 RepID=A0A369VXT1_9SPHN|nr:zinc-binding alcohol dehydrogenase family protein [Sphingomonas aracearum]RDE07186.1 zinc-binding alcohol dehydrogenase family protein [Sphingomonas aracearum]
MRAIAFRTPGPVDAAEALVDLDLPRPAPGPRDLLVEVRAVSVNPVDAKVRGGLRPTGGEWTVLGYDAAGVVVEVGAEVTGFCPGDEVFYAGVINRPGTNAEFHLVDERIVGSKPASLGFADAAALPLTSVTAWEALFDRLEVSRAVPGAPPALLVIGGAGGVASMTVQLARARTDLTVIATASRDETREWVRALGAHHVLDHRQPMAPQLEAAGLGQPGFVFSTTHSDVHREDIAALIAPQGRLALIDDPASFDIIPFKQKAVSIHWELMFTRPLFETADMARQGEILNEVAALVDAGTIRTTAAEHFGTIGAENLLRAHRLIESGKARGKVVLEGF